MCHLIYKLILTDFENLRRKKQPLKVILSAQKRLNWGNGSIQSCKLVLQMAQNQSCYWFTSHPHCAGKATEKPRKSERKTWHDLVTALASPREKRWRDTSNRLEEQSSSWEGDSRAAIDFCRCKSTQGKHFNPPTSSNISKRYDRCVWRHTNMIFFFSSRCDLKTTTVELNRF